MKNNRHITQKRKVWSFSVITAVICLLLSINTLHAKAKTGGLFIRELTGPLAAGASGTIGSGTNTISNGVHTINANANDANRFAESNETNNTLSQLITIEPTVLTVMVDFSVDRGPVTYRASGFLLGISATTPSSALVNPLKPKFFRFDNGFGSGGIDALYPRIQSLGAVGEFILSDSYGYSAPYPGDNSDYTRWDLTVTNIVTNAKNKGQNLQFDIWNEPSNAQFWGRSQSQYLDMWAHTFQLIRSINPNTVIVGPSGCCTQLNTTWLQTYLTYVKANNVIPNILSWHYMDSPFNIETLVNSMRTLAANNGLTFSGYELNESMSPTDGRNGLRPADAILYFAALERAGVSNAAKSCWNEVGGGSDCSAPRLDGLVSQDGLYPRSIWWAYKGYGDITGRLYAVTTGDSNYDGIAGYDSVSKIGKAVFGNYTSSNAGVQLRFSHLDLMSGLVNEGKIHVKVESVPNSETSNLTSIPTVVDSEFTVSNNEVVVPLASFEPWGAVLVTLTPTGATRVIVPRSNVSQMNVFPNPAGDVLTIELIGIAGKQQVEIFNVQGILVKEIEITGTKLINISDLPKGIYLVHLKNNSLEVQKFTKQ
ncbi:MAG: T9SS type A sorting domain-containing protein [Lentimicrobiaceae bacterium]|nr:T9SS type A sorting domain-containing protein [Lentimicrobiaceae bacterium]